MEHLTNIDLLDVFYVAVCAGILSVAWLITSGNRRDSEREKRRCYENRS
ncbi:hypothetical protein GCM10009425_40910 [Pseudomonas asuensis]|uniref:Uncharacterized protein n=1 Tax=Pseudomonas asuensis TaxID=1825787 RepID=A0ABQ2H2Y4_9PSED|nr:hypothetical protein GCM10009425_40910 [Pseudomonas asuensis]